MISAEILQWKKKLYSQLGIWGSMVEIEEKPSVIIHCQNDEVAMKVVRNIKSLQDKGVSVTLKTPTVENPYKANKTS